MQQTKLVLFLLDRSKKLHWDLKDPAIFKGNEEEKLAEIPKCLII